MYANKFAILQEHFNLSASGKTALNYFSSHGLSGGKLLRYYWAPGGHFETTFGPVGDTSILQIILPQ